MRISATIKGMGRITPVEDEGELASVRAEDTPTPSPWVPEDSLVRNYRIDIIFEDPDKMLHIERCFESNGADLHVTSSLIKKHVARVAPADDAAALACGEELAHKMRQGVIVWTASNGLVVKGARIYRIEIIDRWEGGAHPTDPVSREALTKMTHLGDQMLAW